MCGNFKARCINNGDFNTLYTSGKIYEISNGVFTFDNGEELDEPINCFEDLINITSAIWELIEEEGENKMEDLRELIKPCYLVKFRNGRLVFVGQFEDGICLDWTNNTQCLKLSDYNNNLQLFANSYDNYDIIEIYGYNPPYATTELSIISRPLIWKRTEKSPTQIKLEELEKKQREIADEMEKLRKEM